MTIDWISLEKEFRDIHKGDPNPERTQELREFALNNNREFVVSGSQAWLVEYEEIPEVIRKEIIDGTLDV